MKENSYTNVVGKYERKAFFGCLRFMCCYAEDELWNVSARDAPSHPRTFRLSASAPSCLAMLWVNYVLGVTDLLLFFVFVPVHVATCLVGSPLAFLDAPTQVLSRDRHFSERPVYGLLLQLLIANVVGLISTFGAGVFELADDALLKSLDVTMAALALWYRHIYSTLTLLLSVNRLSWITNLVIPYEKDFYRYFFFALWFSFTVLIMFANYVSLNIGYNFQARGFSYFTETAQSENAFPDYIYTMAMMMLTSFLYGMTAAVAAIRYKYNKLCHIDPEEFGVFVQVTTLFIPKMATRYSRHAIIVYAPGSPLLQVNIFFYRIVPALNICSLLYQNRRLRERVSCLLPRVARKNEIRVGASIS
uniref:7TM_GPCR_Srx domain-containing protein n=1 Tax=Steinernema glaseri TaxID=37863 RepID=A0A1I8AHX6_9BILA